MRESVDIVLGLIAPLMPSGIPEGCTGHWEGMAVEVERKSGDNYTKEDEISCRLRS